VRISAKVDYALRALAVLATAGSARTKGDVIAAEQDIPLHFLENILRDLKRAGIVEARRGAHGGYRLAVEPSSVTVADVIRIVEGPLADVHGQAPENVTYPGPATALRDVWIAVRANLRAVLESVTLADVSTGQLPDAVADLVNVTDAWVRRYPSLQRMDLET
jgi:Rrf2 family protein